LYTASKAFVVVFFHTRVLVEKTKCSGCSLLRHSFLGRTGDGCSDALLFQLEQSIASINVHLLLGAMCDNFISRWRNLVTHVLFAVTGQRARTHRRVPSMRRLSMVSECEVWNRFKVDVTSRRPWERFSCDCQTPCLTNSIGSFSLHNYSQDNVTLFICHKCTTPCRG